MRNIKCLLVLAIFSSLFSHSASATVLNVPSPEYPTIQAGLNAAAAGDTVLVAPGIYNVNIIFWPARNGITLLGSGMDNTIVIGDAWQAVFYVASAVPIDSTTVIQGLTIRKGGDAGVILNGSSPMIESCRIDSSSAGPGIYAANDAGVIVRRCVIKGNSGPGIQLENCDSSLRIVENHIVGNRAWESSAVKGVEGSATKKIYPGGFVIGAHVRNGGGIYCYYCSPTIIGNTIAANSAADYGGGIYFQYSNPAIIGNTISADSADYGGGICCLYISSSTITGNTISANLATYGGGGIYCRSSSNPIISGNTLTRNRSWNDGGGFYVIESNPTFRQNTITENTADNLGDGFYTDNTTMSIDSCNIAYNGWGIHNANPMVTPVAKNNWWGQPNGPWHQGYNPAGLGDSLNAYALDFSPWLTQADTLAPPIPPIGLRVLELSATYIKISWSASPIADLVRYRVYFDSDSSGAPYSNAIDVALDTTYTIPILAAEEAFYIAVTCYDNSGNESWYSKEIIVTPGTPVVSSPLNGDVSKTYRLHQNYPNPFNPTTWICYQLQESGPVTIKIYNINGQLINTLVNETQDTGIYRVIWSGDDLSGTPVAAGIYFCQLKASDFSKTIKMVLMK